MFTNAKNQTVSKHAFDYRPCWRNPINGQFSYDYDGAYAYDYVCDSGDDDDDYDDD